MRRRFNHFGCHQFILTAFLMSAVCRAAVSEVKTSQKEGDFFSEHGPVRIDLSISTNLFPELRQGNPRYVPAVFCANTSVIEFIGVRLKGVSGFEHISQRPCFALKFDAFEQRRRFGGLSKLLLNNGSQDQCQVREAVASKLFRAAGVPAARTRPVRVNLNGRDLGIYLAVEAMNKDFLRRHFNNASGNLHEGTMRDINVELELDNGSDETQSERRNLLAASLEPDPLLRWRALSSVLDVDRFLRFAALDVFLGHGDGYLRNSNNYRLYADPVTGKIVFIPHGLDRTFILSGTVEPSTNSLVMRGLYTLPEGRAAYKNACDWMLTNVWRPPDISNQIDAVMEDLDKLAASPAEKHRWRACEGELQALVAMRYQEILENLSRTPCVILDLKQDESVSLTGWFHQTYFGKLDFLTTTRDHARTIEIYAKSSSSGAWKTRYALSAGDYRLTGYAMAAGVTAGTARQTPRAVIRIPTLGEQPIIPNGRSQEFHLDFAVLPDTGNVEFAFELQSGSGRMTLDVQSLRLSRLKAGTRK